MHSMKKLIIILLYIVHLLLTVFALIFAAMYFVDGQQALVASAAETDKELMASYRWWGVVVAVFYNALMFIGVHLLVTGRRMSFGFYASGSGVYLIANAIAYLYAHFQKIETTASVEDLAFNLLFLCLSGLVYLLGKSQREHNNVLKSDPRKSRAL